jgi:cellobiose phosphorylase
MMKKYFADTENGVFTVAERETGKDWCNFLWNDEGYQTEVTHTGGTTSLFVDKNSERIVLNETKSGVIYFRDRESGKYWTTGGYPAADTPRHYDCEHSLKDTRIASETDEIFTEIVYAVAEQGCYGLRRVRIENRSPRARKIDVFAGLIFRMDGYEQPFYYNAPTTSETKFLSRCNAVICLSNNPYAKFAKKHGFIASSAPVSDWEGYTDNFTGLCGGLTKPSVLEKGEDLSHTPATVRSRCGFLEHRLLLKSGEMQEIYFFSGFCRNEETLIAEYPKMLSDSQKLLENIREEGRQSFRLRTRTPDPRFDLLMNYWAEKQVRYCSIGKKAVRDNAQLAMGFLNFDPEAAKKTLQECLAHQYKDGHAALLWYPVVDKKTYSDPAFWLVWAVCEYIKETGDYAFLEEESPWLDGDAGSAEGSNAGSVSEHLKAAVRWYVDPENRGEHGLPKLYYADWNDALNIPDENAESVFMGECVCLMMKELSALYKNLGDKAFAEAAEREYAKMSEIVNKTAWNGEYYVRAFSKYGVVGDKTSEYGKFYINVQSFAILAGIVPEDRKDKLFKAIDERVTKEGVQLCTPPYAHYDERVGRMSGMLAGVYENGGIYNHAGCFKVMADCVAGRGEEGYRTLSTVIPDGEYNPSSRTTVEPYVFVNCYLKHPSADMLCGPSWQTGTSAWGLRCYYEGLLGIRRAYDGLKIAPALPKEWPGVEAWRDYRGNRLHFIYKRGTPAALLVDGKKLEGNTLPPFQDHLEHTITVIFE